MDTFLRAMAYGGLLWLAAVFCLAIFVWLVHRYDP